jgi:hypothetical protein
MMEWQPIETAPKDGSYVLIFTTTRYTNPKFPVYAVAAWNAEDECWAESHSSENWGPDWGVTHWAKLEPPK